MGLNVLVRVVRLVRVRHLLLQTQVINYKYMYDSKVTRRVWHGPRTIVQRNKRVVFWRRVENYCCGHSKVICLQVVPANYYKLYMLITNHDLRGRSLFSRGRSLFSRGQVCSA